MLEYKIVAEEEEEEEAENERERERFGESFKGYRRLDVITSRRVVQVATLSVVVVVSSLEWRR